MNSPMIDINPLVLNVPMCDYWRGTTWSWDTYVKMVTEVVHAMHGDLGKPGKFMQYEGNRYAHAFHGQGTQNGRPHYLVQLSGYFADTLYADMVKLKPVTTRVDYQITIDKPGGFVSRETVDMMRNLPWPGRRRKVTLIDGGGDDTIYIGSRTSDRFIRIYVKHEKYLRFEVEFKSERARRAVYVASGEGMGGILKSELEKLPDVPIVHEFKKYLQGIPADVRVAVESPDMARKLAWLRGLLPTIRKMTNDHDHGEMVRGWLEDVLTTAGE